MNKLKNMLRRSIIVCEHVSNLQRNVQIMNIHNSAVHYLFSPASLGLDNYISSRKTFENKFADRMEKFRGKMEEFVGDNPQNLIFTEDLKNMIHISKHEDLDLVLKMIKKFNIQSSDNRFGQFVFGPVVMRMFHFLDDPDKALKCFNDPDNKGFFDQQVSHQILLDMLYEHKRYDDMYAVFDNTKMLQLNMTKYPKYIVLLVMAGCYRQNTPGSFKYASDIWKGMVAVGSMPLRRACSFFAVLALNQGAAHIALEVMTTQYQQYHVVKNVKAIALASVGRLDDAVMVLKSTINTDDPTNRRNLVLKEAVDKIQHAVSQSTDKELQKEFENVNKILTERNLIDPRNLDDILSQEIQISRTVQDPNQVKLHATYQGNRRTQYGQNRDRTRNMF